MFLRHHRRIRILFAFTDLLLTALAFFAAYETRVHLSLERNFYLAPEVRVLLLGWSVFVWIATSFAWETYDRLEIARPIIIVRDTLRQALTLVAAIVLLQYFLRLDLSRPFVALFGIYAWILSSFGRWNAPRLAALMRRGFAQPHYVLIVGLGESALRVATQLEGAAADGIRLSGFVADGSETGSMAEQELASRYPVYKLSEIPDLLKKDIIDEIIFAVDSRRLAEIEDIFLLCDEEGVRTRVAVDFFPHVNSRVYLDRLGDAPLLTFSATPHDELPLFVKRATDVVLSAAALIVFAPFLLLVGLLVRMTSPGPAIFTQVRCGLNGRRFVFYKFRSMCKDAESMRAGLEEHNEREIVFKIADDPRLTPVGKWIRKFSIDEWPQLWNVLKGDMSLVGPRPAVPEEVEQYKRWQRRRLRMRPGLTCLWAISGRDAIDFETWMKMDMQYIDQWSLGLDWRIILRTIPSVITGRGAH
ncbi:MAG: sugar transferase [Bryobacteraceae bacterium]